MNARITSVLVLSAALSAPALIPLSAAPSAAVGYPAGKITVTTWNDLLDRFDTRAVVDGSSRQAVVSTMGQPAQEWSSNVWVYDGVQPNSWRAQAQGCNILAITFAHGKVTRMRFYDPSAATIVADNFKAGRAERFAANE
jgi:hypothetical protein